MKAWRGLGLLFLGLGSAACGLLLGIPDAIRDDSVGQEAGKGDVLNPDGPAQDTGGKDTGDQDTGMMMDGAADGGKVPVPLTSNNRPWGLAIDDMFLFWSEPTNWVIGRCNKDGSNAVQLATGSPYAIQVRVIAADGAHVYWAQFDKIYKCARGGCGNAPTAIVTGLANSAYTVGLDSTYVYFVEAVPKTLYRVPKSGGSEQLLATLTADANSILVDNGFVIATLQDGSVVKVPVGGGSPVVLTAVTGKDARGLTITNARAYYTVLADPATIGYTPLASPQGTTPVALMQRLPFGITNDITDLYWTETVTLGPSGNVKKCSLANCGQPIVVASMQNVPKWVVSDTAAIYWTNFGNGNNEGELMKLLK